jgi:spore maturation protein A
MLLAIFNVPNKTLEVLLRIGGLIIFYNGLMQIALDSGLITKLSHVFKRLIDKLFPSLPHFSPARDHICLSLVANLLGLGVAGTPSTIKALQLMKEENQGIDEATSEMSKFILLNITSFTLFPVTALSVRKIFFSKINLQLLPYFSLCSFFLTVFALIILKITEKKNVR